MGRKPLLFAFILVSLVTEKKTNPSSKIRPLIPLGSYHITRGAPGPPGAPEARRLPGRAGCAAGCAARAARVAFVDIVALAINWHY